MRVSRPSLYAVLTGQGAVTADIALRFGKLTGAAPALHMQDNYDLWQARNRVQQTLRQIKPAA